MVKMSLTMNCDQLVICGGTYKKKPPLFLSMKKYISSAIADSANTAKHAYVAS